VDCSLDVEWAVMEVGHQEHGLIGNIQE